MGSTVTHSRRPGDRPPVSCPPSEPFGPLSSPLLTTAPTSLLWSTLVTIQNTKEASQYPQPKILICVQCRRE